ncbi:MAG: hypothetical protein ACK5U7_13780 [Bacteroidota bacterium]|jgi:hypothetical protein
MTDLDTMTTAQLCDWHAERAGWKYEPGVEGDPVWHKRDANWQRGHDHPDGSQYEHPFPPTLDGAASAMPEGWWWTRDGGPTPNPQGLLLKWSAMQIGANRWGVVTVPDTGDETRDRYLLAAEAVMKEAGE